MPKTRMEDIVGKLQSGGNKQLDPRESMLQNISKGSVIPVISNSFRIEQIFRELSEEVASNSGGASIYEQLTQVWAREIGYPAEDGYNLARVATYFIEQIDDSELSKVKYLDFLSNFLFAIAGDDSPDYLNLANELKAQNYHPHFSGIVGDLHYPRFPENMEDPLRLLARFPLPVYITTSYFNFMERALEAEGKTPQTQICFWSGEMTNIGEEHRTNRDFTPSVTHPLVYHFYGLEDYPGTIVLSQDEFLDFLMTIAMDTNTQAPLIPFYLRQEVRGSQLLFLGYQQSGWEFRILFQLLMKFRMDGFSPRGLIVQPGPEDEFSDRGVIDYLRRYFGRRAFDLEWNDPERFIQKLWEEWKALRED